MPKLWDVLRNLKDWGLKRIWCNYVMLTFFFKQVLTWDNVDKTTVTKWALLRDYKFRLVFGRVCDHILWVFSLALAIFYDFETSAKMSGVNRITKCKSVPRANRAHQNFRFETFQCGCSYAGCISLIGGPAQPKFLCETLDNLLKETLDSAQAR